MSKLRIRKKKPLGSKLIGVTLDEDTAKQLEELKARTGVGKAELVRQMIIFSLRRINTEEEDNSQA